MACASSMFHCQTWCVIRVMSACGHCDVQGADPQHRQPEKHHQKEPSRGWSRRRANEQPMLGGGKLLPATQRKQQQCAKAPPPHLVSKARLERHFPCKKVEGVGQPFQARGCNCGQPCSPQPCSPHLWSTSCSFTRTSGLRTHN